MFGNGFAVSGSHLAIAAPGFFPYTTTPGRVFMYERTGSDWNLIATIDDPISSPTDLFGDSIDWDGDTLVVGELRDRYVHVHVYEYGATAPVGI